MSVFFTSMEDVSNDGRILSGYEKSASAPTTPTETSRVAAHSGSAFKRRSKGHRVNFPTDDRIVTGYVDPPNPWSNGELLPGSRSLRDGTTAVTVGQQHALIVFWASGTVQR